MAKPKPKPSRKPPRRDNAVHARLPIDAIAKLDALAARNNITRSAVVAIACARIIVTGI